MITKNKNLFDTAHHYYQDGDYQKALQTYQQISDKTSAVWNNMANAAYQSDDRLHAQLYWLRAQKNSSQAMATLVYHNQEVAQIPSTAGYIQQLSVSFTPLFFQILFFCLFSVFLIIVARYIRQKKYVLITMLSLISIASGTLTYQIYQEHNNKYGLIMTDSAIVYVGPGTFYHPLDKITQGTKVLVCEQKNGWEKVVWKNKTGWISTSDIEII